LYYARIRRSWRKEIVAFAISADSGWHFIKLSDIDPATLDAAVNHSLHRIRRVSVDLGARKSSPLPFPPILAGTSSSSRISIQRPWMQL
jgi:hypothetical protein